MCDESKPTMFRSSSSRIKDSSGDTILEVSHKISTYSVECGTSANKQLKTVKTEPLEVYFDNRVECGTSAHIDKQLKTVKSEPLGGYLDSQSLEEHSPTHQQFAASEKAVNVGIQSGTVITKHLQALSPNREHTWVLDTTLQANQVSTDSDSNLLVGQENGGLCIGITSEVNKDSCVKSNHFGTSEIKSRIIGQKRVCCNIDSQTGSLSSQAFTISVKNESMEDSCNDSQNSFNNSRNRSISPEFDTALISAASLHCNESGTNVSSRTCNFPELQYTAGSSRICAPTLSLPILEKERSISRTLLATLSGKHPTFKYSFGDTILHTEENSSSFKPSNFIREAKTEPFELVNESFEENLMESSTFIRKVKTEPFETANEASEENFSESSTFIRKATTEPFEPAIETSENGENDVCHLDMLRDNIKEEELNEYPSDVIDHISLKDRSSMLLVRRTYSFAQYTAENLNSSKLPTFTEAKAEPFELAMDTSEDRNNTSIADLLRDDVKAEKISDSSWDMMDHISLKDRLKMLLTRQGSYFKPPMISKNSKATDPSFVSHAIPRVANSAGRRKRKRTATDSVEEALGEDAPELLQVLVDQGINVEEIKLYEVMDGEDDLDVSGIEESFSELGNVLSKLFFERSNSVMKLNSLRDLNSMKASYSLSCLISLIQQAQYLQLRKCTVEWGWCRDLQSFIFVFEKHNRIVLERPEYGYATYFFELVESLPIDWQIKRLVIAMKLINCSRIAIIENKPLMVGQDLTEGEARVLQDYGWKPKTGLASMLNFCDRVVHDRRTEMCISEWRSKIGRLLMDGFDGGRVFVQELPRKVVQYIREQNSEFKVEIGTVDVYPDEKQL